MSSQTKEERARFARKLLIRWNYPKNWVNSLSDDEAIRQRDIEWAEADKDTQKEDV